MIEQSLLGRLGNLKGVLAFLPLLLAAAGCSAAPTESTGAQTENLQASNSSELVSWTCAGTPCPWGDYLDGQAIVWPASAGPVNTRLGYAVSAGIYLPAASANGVTVSLETGDAGVYAGLPSADSHRLVAYIGAGEPYQITGIAPGEVVSVQSGNVFTYSTGTGSPTPPPVNPPPPPPPDPVPPPPTDPGPPANSGGSGAGHTADPTSSFVTWTCTGGNCPWGGTTDGQAIVWPASSHPANHRLGYTVSAGIYLPAENANGVTVSVLSGSATAYAGTIDAPFHRALQTITPGQPFQITGLVAGEVVSIQNAYAFTFNTTLPGTVDPGTTNPPANPPPNPPNPGDPPPVTGNTNPSDVINSVQAFWRCNVADCSGDPWVGAVINWPSWAAYQSNARLGYQSRSVFTASGQPLNPYMGAWANGCKVTARSGSVLIIEWQRGTDTWRETWLEPGQSHVISLHAPENSAMIETYDYSPGFSVSLENCNPQPLP